MKKFKKLQWSNIGNSNFLEVGKRILGNDFYFRIQNHPTNNSMILSIIINRENIKMIEIVNIEDGKNHADVIYQSEMNKLLELISNEIISS